MIERWGPEAVMPLNYAGPHGMLAGDSMSLRFFHKLGASLLYRRSLCGAVRTEAWTGTYGAVPGIPPELAEDAKLNVIWGNNATVANLHLVRKVRRSLRKGGRLVVVDPKRTKIAEQADLHLATQAGNRRAPGVGAGGRVRAAGRDRPERSSPPMCSDSTSSWRGRASGRRSARLPSAVWRAEAIRTCARWMAEAEPLVLSLGNGLERNRSGGSGIRAAIALPALLGKLGGKSGIVLGAGNAFPEDRRQAAASGSRAPTARARSISSMSAGTWFATTSIRRCGPCSSTTTTRSSCIPTRTGMRQGLKRDDIFAVGIDVTMTESMAHADIVLPAATHFECDDLYAAYGHHWLQRAEPVIRPQGEALPNTEIFRRLARTFGFEDPCFAASDEAADGRGSSIAADARLRGMRPSAIPIDRGTRDDGAGWPSVRALRQRLAGYAFGQDRAHLAKRWPAAGARARACPSGGRFVRPSRSI